MIFALALAAAVSCTSSPTEPRNDGGTPITPKPPAPQVTYNITVTANPNQIATGGSSSNVVVEVRQADNGAIPADGSVVHLSTTLGAFGSPSGQNAIDLQLVGGRAAATLYAAATGETGTATVRATFSNSSGAASVRIGAAATFFVSSVEPNVGTPQGGDTVAIVGGGFEGPVRVTFNGAAASVRSVTPGRITVVTPSAAAAGVPVSPGETQTVDVAVTINLNEPTQQSDTVSRGFTYALGGGTQQPVVLGVNPPQGTNDGGDTVTILGDGFQAPVQVLFGRGSSAGSFNGTEATVVSVDSTHIVVKTPPARGFGQNLTNQVADILVKNLNNGLTAISTQAFKFGTNVRITAMTQGSGPYTGGTRVIIEGSGFDEPVAVSFSFGSVSVAQQVVQTSGNQIVIQTSAAPLPAQCPRNGLISSTAVSVTNIDTGDSATANIGFNFVVPLPQVGSVSPGSGTAGTSVTVRGGGFFGSPQVVFGDPSTGSTAQVTSVSTTALTVVVPNPPSGFTFDTQPCGTGGTQSIPTAVSVTVTNSDTGCAATFRNGFLLAPTDTTCRNQTPGTPPTAAFDSQVLNAATHSIQFINQSTGSPTSFLWDFGDGQTSTAQNPSHQYAATGNYAVKLTVTNASGSNQVVKVIAVP